MKKPFVVGAGIMGAGVGQLCAQQGYDVTVVDISDQLVEKAKGKVTAGLSRRVESGKITQDEMDAVLSRLNWSTDLELAGDSDFVVEAIIENIESKKEVFQKLDSICPPETILATNTTALSVSDIALATQRPDKVVGMHFFNPAVIMKLVEIIRGNQTSDETIAATKKFAEDLGKVPITTAKEAPAGIVSRVLAGLLNEAATVYADGIASAGDIDEAMKLGAGLPMGPLALIDMIGLDIHLAKMETLYGKLKDERYKPPEIIRKMIAEGKLGKKSGEGFYKY
ncbi:MAG: 3-hydroxyacyl-CoA dehydrogenase NAD-binding domain-containing protein [Candidatus Aminicenantes bacterium]|nr:3-hydroxyacyl-CoA dehydrogenase NAD-binding domain-containing protein [Candidatus Aminicenantes bacterium]MDH5705536.1 3-hydroxyacyl-CoA dehydrogenase NAD-binding domain-containing protein [Candidatus Aminicenantes bacterium]